MSKYYELRKEAFNSIREMVEKGSTKSEIVYKIAISYGFSKRFVDEAITTIEGL